MSAVDREATMHVTIEKTRLNAWNVGSVVVGIVITAFGWGVVYSTMISNNNAAISQINAVADDVKEIQLQLPAITQLQYQQTRATEEIGKANQAVDEANKRIDRVVESFGGKLDTVIDSVNKIATSVEVLKTRFGSDQTPLPQRTRMTKQERKIP